MTRLATRTGPWFALAAVLAIVALVAFDHIAQGVLLFAAMAIVWGASIRAVGLAQRDNPGGSPMTTRYGFEGLMAQESRRKRRR
jgi:hypothetical protein